MSGKPANSLPTMQITIPFRSLGFTLVEILWVILIVTVLLSASMPYFSGAFHHLEVKKKVQEVFMALRYAQQKALNQDHTFGLFFDITEGNQMISCYQRRVDHEVGEPLLDANTLLIHPLTKKPYQIPIPGGGNWDDLQIIEADFGGQTWLDFEPLFDTNQAGRVVIKGADISYAIRISRIGRLSLQELAPE